MKESIENIIKKNQNVEKFIEIKHNPVITSAISLLKNIKPIIGDLLDDATEAGLAEFQNKKQQQLIDMIRNAPIGSITSKMLNGVEFIMSFMKTIDAVNKTLNADKVKFYGNLLINGYLLNSKKTSVDEFEEYIELINSLSYSELEYLSFFKKYSDKYNGQLLGENWKEFCEEFIANFPNTNPNYVFKRLLRTGFISEEIETANVNSETLSFGVEFKG